MRGMAARISMMLRVKGVAVSWFHTVLLGTSPDESLVPAKWTGLHVRAPVLMVIVQNPRQKSYYRDKEGL